MFINVYKLQELDNLNDHKCIFSHRAEKTFVEDVFPNFSLLLNSKFYILTISLPFMLYNYGKVLW